ncbi:hypothetical protein [uncultured Sphingomonas sp.]|uniref:hypothetical protein n=1 Tax=uncultured Sphingomonas sp. TaxID=158754 RepID=UPI00261581AB|nr:hypothetical protein [uncultured Sphingomonas sp.]
MYLNVALDHGRSEHAGAAGMFQIESVRNADTGEDLTYRIDVGVHHSGVDDLEKYLKGIFGGAATFDFDD